MRLDEMLRVELETLPESDLMALMDAVSDEVKRRYMPAVKTGDMAGQVRRIFEAMSKPTSTDLKGPERR